MDATRSAWGTSVDDTGRTPKRTPGPLRWKTARKRIKQLALRIFSWEGKSNQAPDFGIEWSGEQSSACMIRYRIQSRKDM